jgi:sugar fermentation stimulation protein A
MRFTADVLLDDRSRVQAHCPNSGRMLTCSEPGRPVYLSESPSPRRKYGYTWEMIGMPGSLVVVNTLRANLAAHSAIGKGLMPELSGYTSVRREVAFGRARFDLFLEAPGVPGCIVEVKSSTLAEDGVAMFPDAVSQRAARHVEDLLMLKERGFRTVVLFLVMRGDACTFMPASHIDPVFASALESGLEGGLEALVYCMQISLGSVTLGRRLPLVRMGRGR